MIEGYIALSRIHKTDELKRNCHNVPFASLTNESKDVRSFPDILRRGAVGTSAAGLPAVLTRCPRLDKLGRYDDAAGGKEAAAGGGGGSEVVRVQSFESKFSLAESGMSRPMIVTCIGSDGRRYRQVCDDDGAVMVVL